MTASLNDPAVVAAREAALRSALDLLHSIANSSGSLTKASVLARTASALDHLGHAAALWPSLRNDAPNLLAQACDLLSECMPVVVSALPDSIFSDEVAIGLGCASSILSSPDDPLWYDRLLRVAKLRIELQLALATAEIARRGDPIQRSIAIKQALAAPRPCNIRLQ